MVGSNTAAVCFVLMLSFGGKEKEKKRIDLKKSLSKSRRLTSGINLCKWRNGTLSPSPPALVVLSSTSNVFYFLPHVFFQH